MKKRNQKKKKKKKRNQKKTGRAGNTSSTQGPAEDIVAMAIDGDGDDDNDDGMAGLARTMLHMSMVPRSISFGRRARNRAPERSRSRRQPLPLQAHGGKTSGRKASPAGAVLGTTAGTELCLVEVHAAAELRRPNRRERRAAARAAAAAQQVSGDTRMHDSDRN